MSRFDVDWDEMEDLRVVAPFLDELRTEFAEGPAPYIGTELATLFVFGAPPVGVVTPPKTRSRARVVRRVAAGAIGGLALVGGMGAAGALPGAIQEPVANAARYVGINLPHPHHHHRADKANTERSGTHSTPVSTPRTHHQTHVSTTGPEPTLSSPDGSSTGTSGAGSTSRTTVRAGSGSSTSTGNSTVTGSGSAVSSTSSDTHNGTNQGGRHPTYHGNGRTTRDQSGSTSTTAPPPSDGSGSGTGDGTSSPSTTPTTAAPA